MKIHDSAGSPARVLPSDTPTASPDTVAALALLLGLTKGEAATVLADNGGLAGLALAKTDGLTPAQVKKVGALLDLAPQVQAARAYQALTRRACHAPSLMANWAHHTIGGLTHEELWVMALDAQHQLLRAARVGQGARNGVLTSVASVLRPLIVAGAAGFVMIHNHPSGDTNPSGPDVQMTAKVARAAGVVGVTLVDHLIVGPAGDYTSLFERGLIPKH